MTAENASNDTGPAESRGRGIPFLEKFSDRMNPILVKEVRQAMKSRAFVVTFLLMILTCWLIAVIGALTIGASLEYYSYAEQFFASFFIPLAIAIGVVVPFLAYFSMLNERMDDTFEMLSITTLNARRIVSGKLTNAMVLVLLCFSAITPFIAFTSLMQGFRMVPVVVSLVGALFASLGLCSIALLASTLAHRRVMQGLIALVLLGFLGYSTACGCALMFVPDYWMMPANWFVVAAVAGICFGKILIVLLLREVAVARITFASDNRATGVRLMTTVVVLALLLTLYITAEIAVATGAPPGAFWQVFPTLSNIVLILVGAVSYFSCTEHKLMSARVRQQVNKLHPVLRFLAMPWLPGCHRGYLFCLIHLVPIVVANHLLWQSYTSSLPSLSGRRSFMIPGRDAPIPLEIGLYVLAYMGIAVLIANVFYSRRPNVRSTTVRATFLVIICAMAIIPHLVVTLLEQIYNYRIQYDLYLITSPYATVWSSVSMDSLASGKDMVATVTLLLGTLAAALFALHLPDLLRTVRDTIAPLPKEGNPADGFPGKEVSAEVASGQPPEESGLEGQAEA